MSEPLFTDRCLPGEWQDEAIPRTAPNPSDFLCLRDGQIWLVPIEDREEFLAGKMDPDSGAAPVRSLDVGDAVEFQFTRTDFPNVGFRVLDDGAITLIDPVPEGANLFGCGAALIVDENPVAAARAMFEDDPGEREIECWYWSGSFIFVVCTDENGVPGFEAKGMVQ
jgi:hypothetical protein